MNSARSEFLATHLLFLRNLSGVYSKPVHDVIVYSRKQCHLCDVVKETLARLESAAEFHWREIDIDTDPELQRLYNEEVPVVFIDGRKAFKYTLDEKEFLKRLKGRG